MPCALNRQQITEKPEMRHKKTVLVALSVLVVLLSIMAFYWTGYDAGSWSERVVYRVNRVTGKVTTVRVQVVDQGHVLDPAPPSVKSAPRHVNP